MPKKNNPGILLATTALAACLVSPPARGADSYPAPCETGAHNCPIETMQGLSQLTDPAYSTKVAALLNHAAYQMKNGRSPSSGIRAAAEVMAANPTVHQQFCDKENEDPSRRTEWFHALDGSDTLEYLASEYEAHGAPPMSPIRSSTVQARWEMFVAVNDLPDICKGSISPGGLQIRGLTK